MDEQRPSDIELEVSGEWFVIAAYLQDVLRRTSGVGPAGVMNVTTAPSHSHIATYIGIAIVQGSGDSTKITFQPHGGTDDEWEHIARQTKRFVGDMQSIRRKGNPSATDAIEHYYRSRARGSRVTLRKVAEELGFNYSYLRAVKAEYDARGGWGSKKTLGDTKHLAGDKRD